MFTFRFNDIPELFHQLLEDLFTNKPTALSESLFLQTLIQKLKLDFHACFTNISREQAQIQSKKELCDLLIEYVNYATNCEPALKFLLAHMSDEAYGCVANKNLAIQLYTEVGEKGFPDAYSFLSTLYKREHNSAQAFKALQRGIQLNSELCLATWANTLCFSHQIHKVKKGFDLLRELRQKNNLWGYLTAIEYKNYYREHPEKCPELKIDLYHIAELCRYAAYHPAYFLMREDFSKNRMNLYYNLTEHISKNMTPLPPEDFTKDMYLSALFDLPLQTDDEAFYSAYHLAITASAYDMRESYTLFTVCAEKFLYTVINDRVFTQFQWPEKTLFLEKLLQVLEERGCKQTDKALLNRFIAYCYDQRLLQEHDKNHPILAEQRAQVLDFACKSIYHRLQSLQLQKDAAYEDQLINHLACFTLSSYMSPQAQILLMQHIRSKEIIKAVTHRGSDILRGIVPLNSFSSHFFQANERAIIAPLKIHPKKLKK